MPSFDILDLVTSFQRRLNHVPRVFSRFLLGKIDWGDRLIGIRGARGCGKTTMLLQRILGEDTEQHKSLYASLDHLWFSNHSLFDLIDWAYQHGLHRIYLDEVHRYAQWQLALKNIYDNYPDVNIVYTGSSLLSIDYAVADLSRRQTLYTLHGLSFREYLAFEDITEISPLSLDNLLDNHLHYAMDITKQIKVAPYFESYLEHGYYPFYKESLTDFLDRLRQTASIAIDIDLPSIEEVSFETLIKIKRLLVIISEQVPFVPNMSSLWKELSTNNTLGIRMLYALDRAGILSLVTNNIKNYKHLSKPDKIFLNDTNLMHALCTNVNKGSERETFFHSQLSVGHEVSIPSQGDFLVDNTILFEVGGKRKTFEQIKDESNGYLAVDDTEIGHAHRIPLWMFGLLY